PGLAEALGGAVGPLLRGDPVGLGRPLNLEPVLVGAGEEEGVVAQEPVPAGQRVGDDRGVGVADVGGVVHVVDGGREVVAGHGPAGYCRPALTPPRYRTATVSGIWCSRWTRRAQRQVVLVDLR